MKTFLLTTVALGVMTIGAQANMVFHSAPSFHPAPQIRSVPQFHAAPHFSAPRQQFHSAPRQQFHSAPRQFHSAPHSAPHGGFHGGSHMPMPHHAPLQHTPAPFQHGPVHGPVHSPIGPGHLPGHGPAPTHVPHSPHPAHPFHLPPGLHPHAGHLVAPFLHHGGTHHGEHGYYDVDGDWIVDDDFPPYDGDLDSDYYLAPGWDDGVTPVELDPSCQIADSCDPDQSTQPQEDQQPDAQGNIPGMNNNKYGATAFLAWNENGTAYVRTGSATRATQELADWAAIQNCGVEGCQVVSRFWAGNCGYSSVGAGNGRAYAGWSNTPDKARQQCSTRGPNCKPAVGVCTHD